VTLPRREPPLIGATSKAPAISEAAAVRVEDHLEPRVRIPADLLRFVIGCVEIGVLVGIALVGPETAHGVEITAVGATNLLPKVLLPIVGFVAPIALLILPVALAVRLLFHRQPRRLAEAVAAGGITVAAVALVNVLLRQPAAASLYDSLTIPHPSVPHPAALDGLLAGLVAYITVIGLSGRPRWRTAFWLAIGFYALAILAAPAGTTTALSLLITLLLGSAIGSGLRYAAGSATERPSATDVAAALTTVDAPVVAMRRIWDASTETRRYAATTRDGSRLDVTVFDRDQQAADAFYRIYRRLRLTAQVSRSAPLTVERAVERRALLTYAVEDAGVLTPRLRALIKVGTEAAVLANDHRSGTTLADLKSGPSEAQLRQVWDTVLQLHAHRVTHRALTADRIMFSGGDGTSVGHDVVLLDPGNGDVAASDLQLRLDLTQLLAELALLVGPDRSADLALEKVSRSELVTLVPLLQRVVMHRSTRTALRDRKDVLPTLRKRLQASVPDGEVAPVQLERIRLRSLVTLVGGIVAAYLLIGQLTKVHLATVFKQADVRWILVALALSAATYVGAAWSLSGFVLERLSLARTFLAQVAGSFVTLVTPAAVGGVALNIRYLRRAGVAPADAAASVGVSQVIAFSLHMLLLVIFAAVTGASLAHSLHTPPDWLYIGLVVLAVGALALLAIPAGRRLIQSRLAPALGQVIPRLLDVAQRPAKLAEGIGGALLLTTAYILCLAASVRALGGGVAVASIAVVYLTGSAIGSVSPTPGGLGAVEVALSAGLTAAGLSGVTALSSVLLFRTLTFWLPVPLGWLSMNYLQRHDAL
jgi:glycosyltransferase 2 family protein